MKRSELDRMESEALAQIAASDKAFAAAVSEGLQFFHATLHVGGTIAFVGHSWEDGGFSVSEAGKPKCDSRGNTVANSAVESLDPSNDQHVAQVEEWYGA